MVPARSFGLDYWPRRAVMRPSQPDYEGLQVRPVENYPQVVHYSDKEALPDRVAKSPGARACTVSRPVFVALLFVAVLVVVGAAVGGGVGAVLAAKNSKSTAVAYVTKDYSTYEPC